MVNIKKIFRKIKQE